MKIILTDKQKQFLNRNFDKLAQNFRSKGMRASGRDLARLANKFTPSAQIIDLDRGEVGMILSIARDTINSLRTVTIPAYSAREGQEEYIDKANATATELENLVKLIEAKQGQQK